MGLPCDLPQISERTESPPIHTADCYHITTGLRNMSKEYVEHRDGGYWITGTRVSLDSVVLAFLRGASPESIAQAFPVLHLEEVFGALAYYLANQPSVEAYLETLEPDFAKLALQSRAANPLLHQKLEEARQSSTSK